MCPPFLRFDKVRIWTWRAGNECLLDDYRQTIEGNLEFIDKQLLPLKTALNDSNMIEFYTSISPIKQLSFLDGLDDRRNFKDHAQLLEYVEKRLLTICQSSRGFTFGVECFPEDLGQSITESILQIPPVMRSHVLISEFP